MRHWLRVSVSALALAAAAPAGAEELARPAQDRFSTEVLLAPSLGTKAPTLPLPEFGAQTDAESSTLGLDTIVTGQIAAPPEAAPSPQDGAEAPAGVTSMPASAPAVPPAEEVQAPASPASPAPVSAEVVPAAVPAAEPAAPAAGHEAAAASPPAEGGDEAAPASEKEGEAAAHPEPPAPLVFETTRGPAPFDIIRTVQFLQDQIARGNGRAIRVQAALLRRFGPVFLAADHKVWEDARNQRAAVLFVLSGGPPDVLRRLLDAGVLAEGQRPLVEGALAYVQNDLDTAAKLIGETDMAGMEPGLAGHLHLVLGQIQQVKKPEEAIRNLDQARLLVPGGLIEEAALRMEVLIVEERGDHALADRLARQYFDRYAHSSYSANFEARFAAVYAGRPSEDPEVSVATILDVSKRLPPDERRGLLLAVARRSLVDGKLKLAELSSDAAAAIEGIPAAERQRAELYATAARLGKSVTSDAAALLDAIDRAELHPDDLKLLDAAHSVVESIERPLEPAEEQAIGAQFAESSPVFDRAQKLLNEVSDDLGKAQK